ncbi:MAG: hypothetical protein KAW17_10390 [Candidatus Eisenbacteria sp.]|nr:hypothetical protein [Candidatus Eisenbacteria bacterium]
MKIVSCVLVILLAFPWNASAVAPGFDQGSVNAAVEEESAPEQAPGTVCGGVADVYRTGGVLRRVMVRDICNPHPEFIEIVDPNEGTDAHKRINSSDINAVIFDKYRVRFINGYPQPAEPLILEKRSRNAAVGIALAIGFAALAISQTYERDDDESAAEAFDDAGLTQKADEYRAKADKHKDISVFCGLAALVGLVVSFQTETVRISPEGHLLGKIAVDPAEGMVFARARF